MCSPKTMLKIGFIIAIPLAIGFITFPQFRTVIISLAPFAIFAVCPLTMMFGVHGMGKKEGHSDNCTSCGHTDSSVNKGQAK